METKSNNNLPNQVELIVSNSVKDEIEQLFMFNYEFNSLYKKYKSSSDRYRHKIILPNWLPSNLKSKIISILPDTEILSILSIDLDLLSDLINIFDDKILLLILSSFNDDFIFPILQKTNLFLTDRKVKNIICDKPDLYDLSLSHVIINRLNKQYDDSLIDKDIISYLFKQSEYFDPDLSSETLSLNYKKYITSEILKLKLFIDNNTINNLINNYDSLF